MTVKASFLADSSLLPRPAVEASVGWRTLPRHDASALFGLPLVLVDAVRQGIDEDDDFVTDIPDFPGLNLTVALALLQRPARWSGGALRHVRTVAEMTGSDLAACSQHADKTVISRWEKDRAPIGRPSELALRHCLKDALADRYPDREVPDLKGLKLTDDAPAPPIEVTYGPAADDPTRRIWRVLSA